MSWGSVGDNGCLTGAEAGLSELAAGKSEGNSGAALHAVT